MAVKRGRESKSGKITTIFAVATATAPMAAETVMAMAAAIQHHLRFYYNSVHLFFQRMISFETLK